VQNAGSPARNIGAHGEPLASKMPFGLVCEIIVIIFCARIICTTAGGGLRYSTTIFIHSYPMWVADPLATIQLIG
jgi:hypothetical protein